MRLRSSITVLFFSVLGSSVVAQEKPAPQNADRERAGWVNEFDEVTVERVDPGDLPEPAESRFPTSLQSTDVLPGITKLETLRDAAVVLNQQVVEVIAVVRPDVGLLAPPMHLRGHGVWISDKPGGADPVLVTPMHWLRGADKIVVLPMTDRKAGDPTKAERRTIDSMTNRDGERLLKTPGAVSVIAEELDPHRNLAILRPASGELRAPAAGMRFFDYEGQSPTRVFGYSPSVNNALVTTQFIAPDRKREELVFYLQTSYPVILGAPIVSETGQLIGLTAMRHPDQPERTLTIPPGAIRHYVRDVQGIDVSPEP